MSMKEPKESAGKNVDLGKCGEVTLFLSDDKKRLLIGFDVDEDGFDKSGLNGFIDALKKIRDKMNR
jgi:hypothetical protein